ncbi:MAG: hypothetical protein NZ741_01775 [Armatimonadetes bacterium]|nr:hypothetical protein [Armatimonadota bacterium]
MSSSGLKREIPGWVGVVVVVVIVAVLVIAGYRYFTASEARKPGQYPPEAYQPPGYAQPMQAPGATAGGGR